MSGQRVHRLVSRKGVLEDRLERWSRRTASVLPLDSGFPPSAPRTGQVAFTTSGAPIPATSAFSHILPAVGFESLVLSRWLFLCPECLDPFALHPALSDSLGGRHSTDYYGSAAPTRALVTSPPIHMGSSCRFRRCSHSNFPIGCRYPSVILQTCEQAREAYPHRQVVFEAPPPPSSRRGFWSSKLRDNASVIGFLPPHSSQIYRIYVGALEGANPLAHDYRRAVDGLSGCSGLPLTSLPWPISATFASWVYDAPARLACVPSKRVLMPTWAESCPGFGRVRTGHPLMS